jgi:hypothetical protein
MRKILITILLVALVGNVKSYCQENSKGVNFVITVDDNVVVGSIANLRLIASDADGKRKIIDIAYIPGELSIKNVDMGELLSSKLNTVLLAFDYYEFCNGKQIIHNYEIEIEKKWFNFSYMVLRVYNLDKKKYRKIFYPLKGCNYTYEIDFPSNSMTRIKRK